jgi:hypothetical protein
VVGAAPLRRSRRQASIGERRLADLAGPVRSLGQPLEGTIHVVERRGDLVDLGQVLLHAPIVPSGTRAQKTTGSVCRWTYLPSTAITLAVYVVAVVIVDPDSGPDTSHVGSSHVVPSASV